MSKELLLNMLGNLTKVETPEESKKTTIDSRKSEWKEAVESLDVDRLLEVQQEMDSFIDKVRVLSKKDSDEIELSKAEAKDLMTEHLSNKHITEFLEARQAMVKEMVFQVIDERLRKEGVENPSVVNGEIQVPELGKVFRKEGAGLKPPSLDMAKLRELLGDRVEEVTVRKTIPEHVVEEVDEDLLVELAQKDESIMEAIQEAAVPGKPKSARFVVRDLK